MEIIKIKNKDSLKRVLEVLESGGVVVCPTDTVYGFLADATNKKAVEYIYKIKNRPRSKPLPVFVKDLDMAKDLAKISDAQEKVVDEKWPGKFTFVLERKKGGGIYGVDEATIALRIPKYKFLNNLLESINKPLAQTSVNVSGQPTLTSIKEIISVFGNAELQPDLIIDSGDLPNGSSSTIIDLASNTINILRK